MKKLNLLICTIIAGYPTLVMAQTCATPPTCSSLGYDKDASACEGRSTLKCPFDTSKVFCVTAGEGASGKCAIANVGDILFSDMSCGSNAVDGKRPIGVIFEADRRLAVALNQTQKYWSTEYFDISGLPNLGTSEAMADFNGKTSTATIMTYCIANSKSCPAAEYAHNYSTLGTKAGDWYLPSLGELKAVYVNKTVVNGGLVKAGGTQLSESYHWSSSEYSTNYAWIQTFSNGGIDTYNKGYSNTSSNYYVRPVLAF